MSEVEIKMIGNYSYRTAHCLGEGVYGKVYEGKDEQTKERVAIKKIDQNTFTNDRYLENAIFSEIYLMKRFNHPNIVRFKDVLNSKNSLYIITEFCKNGDLRELIKRKRFKQEEAFEVVRQILSGFTQLVQEKIIHRDLKPANILVNEGVYKIADFGFAKYVDNFGTQMLKSCVGSPIYMAPQILQRTAYSTKCDIWSIGVIFYEMLFGYPPWKARDEAELLRALRMLPIHQLIQRERGLSAKAADFLKKCLAYSEDDRAGWNELFDLYLSKERLNTPVHMPLTAITYDDSPVKPGENSGRNRYMTVNAPIGVGSAPGPRVNGGLQQFEKRDSLQPSNKALVQPPSKTLIAVQAPPQTPTYPSPQIAPVVAPIQPPISQPIQIPQSQPNHQITVPPQPQNLKRPNAPQQQGNPIDGTVRLNHEQCILKHYLTLQLFTSLPALRQIVADAFKLERLTFLLALSTRVKSTASLNFMASQLKQKMQSVRSYRTLEDLLRKMEYEHQSYEQLEADINKEFERLQIARRIRDDLTAVLIGRTELLSEDKLIKLQSIHAAYAETLYRQTYQSCQILLVELQKRGVNWLTNTKQGSQAVHLLDWLQQLLAILANKDKLLEMSLLAYQPQQPEGAQMISRTLNKVTVFLNSN